MVPNAQSVGAVYNPRLTNCATLLCRACEDFPVCVAVMYPTLRTGCERHGRKNPLPFPYFGAVTCRQSAPDYPRERQEFKEEGKPQVSLPFCPRGGRRESPRSAERNSPRWVSAAKKGCRPAGTYESLRLNSSYPNIRTTSSVPSARRMAISGSGIPLNVLVLTMV